MNTASNTDKEKIQHTEELFEALSQHVAAELSTAAGDYSLLKQLNEVATERYKAMTRNCKSLDKSLDALWEKQLELHPYIEEISELENGVDSLEATVARLDDYSKKLEQKYKNLQTQNKQQQK